MNPFSVEEYKEVLSDPEECCRVPQTQEELERLIVLAMYYEEIERKKLAAQLVMTLGDACNQSMLVDVLRGAYQSATVSLTELEQQAVECGKFSVRWQEEQVRIMVPNGQDIEAEVFADCGAADGQLVTGRVLYQTVEDTVFVLETGGAESFSVFVYTHDKQKETETQWNCAYDN